MSCLGKATAQAPHPPRPGRTGRRRLSARGRVALAPFAFLVACAPAAPPRQAAGGLTVEIAGCRELVGGGCAVGEGGRITVWVSVPDGAEPAVEIAGGGEVEGGETVQDGRRFRLRAAPGATAVVVRAGGARRAVALAWEPEPPAIAAVREALLAGDLDTAVAALTPLGSAPDPAIRATALGLLGRISIHRGDPPAAIAHLEGAVAAALAAGLPQRQIDDATALVHQRLEQREFGAARALLGSLPAAPEVLAEAGYHLAYYRSLLAEETGDLGTALARSAEAVARAERTGLDRRRWLAAQIHARQLQVVGRAADAAALFAGLLAEAGDRPPCERAQLLNNHAWALLLAGEAGEEPASDPVPPLLEALRLLAVECDAGAAGSEVRNVRLNLALAHLQAGRPALAQAALAAAGPGAGGPRLDLWHREVEARLALAQGEPQRALALYRDLGTLAARAGVPEGRWRAAVGEGLAHLRRGERTAAIAALRAADGVLDEESLAVPFDAGRDTFLAQRERGTRLQLELLLQAGAAEEALAVARRARSRALAGLARAARLASLDATRLARWDQAVARYRSLRDRFEADVAAAWTLPLDQRSGAAAARRRREADLGAALAEALGLVGGAPPPPRARAAAPPGELLLAYHPLPSGWAGLARIGGETLARRLDCPAGPIAPEALASCFLAPFADLVERAARLRLLPYGPLQAVDFHALPWRGAPLAARRPVAYGLDLGGPDESRDLAAGTALVVADPRGDLPGSRAEAAAVGRLLAARGVESRLLAGAAATGPALRELLPAVGLFHYAGHAIFAGRAGWESALPLAAESALTVGDVLALARVPRVVVLAGCETGRAGGAAPGVGIGLAHAFLAAGARAVVAAVRPVADATAERLVTGFYRRWTGGSPAAALAAAQLELWQADPSLDAAAFRLIEP